MFIPKDLVTKCCKKLEKMGIRGSTPESVVVDVQIALGRNIVNMKGQKALDFLQAFVGNAAIKEPRQEKSFSCLKELTVYLNSSAGQARWRSLRYDILERDKGKCCLCGRNAHAHGVVLHVDHIVPKSVDISLAFDPENLQVLCEECNLGKSNRFSTDWRNKH